MANCDFCGKKLSFLNTNYVMNQAHTVCDECSLAFNNLAKSDDNNCLENAERLMDCFAQSNDNRLKQEVLEFCTKFLTSRGVHLPDKFEAEIAKIQQKRQEEQQQRERERLEQEAQAQKERAAAHQAQIAHLKEYQGGYYEYKVISLFDQAGLFNKNSGRVDIVAMTKILNDLGMEGWHLITAYSNELGKNAISGGIGGAMLGTNSTVDENILIFERFIKL